jgi:hypothetical protein
MRIYQVSNLNTQIFLHETIKHPRHRSSCAVMETVLRLINGEPGWKAEGALTDTEAEMKFKASKFDLVLIGGGVEAISERNLKTEFEKINPQIKVVRHYGGGSGLLFNEIEEAMN